MTVKKAFSALCGGFALIFMFQVHQTIEQTGVARIDAVKSWALKNKNNQQIAEKYLTICETSEAKQSTVVGCLETVGSDELTHMITQAVDDVRSPLPLRWIVQE